MEVKLSDEEPVHKLTKGAKKIKIDDQDVQTWDELQSAFYEHYNTKIISRLSRATGSKNGATSNPICLFSDLFCGETEVLCGINDGTCKVLDITRLSEEEIFVDPSIDRKHHGLSCIRCSRTSPSQFFSSSSYNDIIQSWDTRMSPKKPSQNFTLDSSSTKGAPKPILQFDVSCNDQLICAGTEMVEEDSYLLFWDVRSTKLLGAYWESHSDDVTAIKFHPHHVYCLASGSTDGLLNVFNLTEPAEDDALQYSFNTNSSVDTVHWPNKESISSKLVCVTHTNDVQVWDSVSGDSVSDVNRKLIAEAMKRSNPEAVHVSSCHNLNDTSRVGLMTCSLSCGNARLIELDDDMKPTSRGLFMNQTAVVQTAQFLQTSRNWLTFDEKSMVKLWSLKEKESNLAKQKPQKLKDSGESKRGKRFKPYSLD